MRKLAELTAVGLGIFAVGLGMVLADWHSYLGVVLMAVGVAYLVWEVFTSGWSVTLLPPMLRFLGGVMVYSALVAAAWPSLRAKVYPLQDLRIRTEDLSSDILVFVAERNRLDTEALMGERNQMSGQGFQLSPQQRNEIENKKTAEYVQRMQVTASQFSEKFGARIERVKNELKDKNLIQRGDNHIEICSTGPLGNTFALDECGRYIGSIAEKIDH